MIKQGALRAGMFLGAQRLRPIKPVTARQLFILGETDEVLQELQLVVVA